LVRFPGFGDRLREARTQQGLRSNQAAAAVGVSRQVWTDWEHGRRAPRDGGVIKAICDLLETDPGWLLGMTEVRRPWPPTTEAG